MSGASIGSDEWLQKERNHYEEVQAATVAALKEALEKQIAEQQHQNEAKRSAKNREHEEFLVALQSYLRLLAACAENEQLNQVSPQDKELITAEIALQKYIGQNLPKRPVGVKELVDFCVEIGPNDNNHAQDTQKARAWIVAANIIVQNKITPDAINQQFERELQQEQLNRAPLEKDFQAWRKSKKVKLALGILAGIALVVAGGATGNLIMLVVGMGVLTVCYYYRKQIVAETAVKAKEKDEKIAHSENKTKTLTYYKHNKFPRAAGSGDKANIIESNSAHSGSQHDNKDKKKDKKNK